MASTPEAITDELPGLYEELERFHLIQLSEIALRFLLREPQLQAMTYLVPLWA